MAADDASGTGGQSRPLLSLLPSAAAGRRVSSEHRVARAVRDFLLQTHQPEEAALPRRRSCQPCCPLNFAGFQPRLERALCQTESQTEGPRWTTSKHVWNRSDHPYRTIAKNSFKPTARRLSTQRRPCSKKEAFIGL